MYNLHQDPQAISYNISFYPVNTQPIDNRVWHTDSLSDQLIKQQMDFKALDMKNSGQIVKITYWLPLRKDFEDIAESQNYLCSLLEVKQTSF